MTPAEPTGQRDRVGDVDLTQLPHESWCNLGSTHADCCPSKAERGCSCITADVVRALDVARAQTVVAAARALVDQYESADWDRGDANDAHNNEVLTEALAHAVRALDSDGGEQT